MSGPVLWLLRHGKAADSLGAADAGRPLTERGEAQSQEAGRTLAGLGVELAAVLTSPRVRARRTAEFAVEAHGDAPAPITFEELGRDYGAGDLLALVSPWIDLPAGGEAVGSDAGEELGADGNDDDAVDGPHVLVVGHNPTLTVVVHALTGDERGLSTGTLVGIDLTARRVVHHVAALA